MLTPRDRSSGICCCKPWSGPWNSDLLSCSVGAAHPPFWLPIATRKGSEAPPSPFCRSVGWVHELPHSGKEALWSLENLEPTSPFASCLGTCAEVRYQILLRPSWAQYRTGWCLLRPLQSDQAFEGTRPPPFGIARSNRSWGLTHAASSCLWWRCRSRLGLSCLSLPTVSSAVPVGLFHFDMKSASILLTSHGPAAGQWMTCASQQLFGCWWFRDSCGIQRGCSRYKEAGSLFHRRPPASFQGATDTGNPLWWSR